MPLPRSSSLYPHISTTPHPLFRLLSPPGQGVAPSPREEASSGDRVRHHVRGISAKDLSVGIISFVVTMVAVLLFVVILEFIIRFFRKNNNGGDARPLNSGDILPDAELSTHPHNEDGLDNGGNIEYQTDMDGSLPMPWNTTPLPCHLNSTCTVNSSTATNARADNIHSPDARGTCIPCGNFTVEELALATRFFSEENLLGEGEFGCVHKGILPNGRRIAVKRLKIGNGIKEECRFKEEVEIIGRVHHKHLVSLVGYCMNEKAERFLVHEFVPNHNLDFHLHGKDQPVMEWATRKRIAIGAAKGLAYLHEDCDPSIVHCDIKASNVLLDSNFEAKLGDVGLVKLVRGKEDDTDLPNAHNRVVGNFGYQAPEYATSGRACDKSDVFSYGMVLLQLITGRNPLNKQHYSTTDCLLSWARPLLKKDLESGKFEEVVDPRLQGNYNNEEMEAMVACANACLRNSRWRRPRMSQIIQTLEGDMHVSSLDEGITLAHHPSSYGVLDAQDFNSNYQDNSSGDMDDFETKYVTRYMNGIENIRSRK